MNFDNNLETDYSTILKERDDLSKERDDLLKERDNLFKKQQNDLFKEQNNINELYNKLDELLRKQNVFKSINKKQNINKEVVTIKKYTRIAQILPEKIYTMNVKKIGKIRGDDCGSTNIKENNKRKQDNDQDDNISIRKNKRNRM